MQLPAGSKQWLSSPLGCSHFSSLPATPLAPCLLLTLAIPDLRAGGGGHSSPISTQTGLEIFSYLPHTTYQYQVIYIQLSLCTQHSARGTALLNKRRRGRSSQSKKTQMWPSSLVCN